MTAQTHTKFLENLRRSARAVDLIAAYLVSYGYDVTVTPILEAPNHEDWASYADHGDLYIQQRIEVKQISRSFTGPQDWPFGKDFIVCAKHSYDRAQPKPAYYYIVASDGEHFACVDVNATAKHWRVEKRRDVRYGDYEQEFYLCPLALVKWGRLGK